MNRSFGTSIRGIRRGVAVALCAAALGLAACSKPTPQETLAEALGLLNEGQTARGVLKLKEMTREHPDDPATRQARIYLARYYVREGNGTRALEELEAAFEGGDISDPTVREAGEGIVSIRAQLKDWEKSLEMLDRITAALPAEAAQDREAREIEKAGLLLAWGEEDESRKAEGLGMLEKRALGSEDAAVRGTAREQLANYWRMRGEFEKCNEVYKSYIDKYPDESIRPRLELAMAVNLKRMEKTAEADALYAPALEKLNAEAEAELDKEARSRILDEAASMAEAYGDLDRVEAIRRRIMGDNVGSQIAIQNQFRIAEMWAVAGIETKDAAKFDKGIAEFERIARDNANTSIGQTASDAIGNARKVFEQAMNPPAEVPAPEGEAPAAETTPEAAPTPEAKASE